VHKKSRSIERTAPGEPTPTRIDGLMDIVMQGLETACRSWRTHVRAQLPVELSCREELKDLNGLPVKRIDGGNWHRSLLCDIDKVTWAGLRSVDTKTAPAAGSVRAMNME
jgi:hypothetical protein